MGIAAGAISAVGGIAKSITGASQARAARSALENYQRQDLKNVYEGVGVSTLGADLQRQEASRLAATSVDALQAAGSRGVLGGLGAVNQQSALTNRQVGADLDQQQKDLDKLRAQDDARIRGIQENRENQDIQGLGQQLEVGTQNIFGGIGDVAGVAGSLGRQAQPSPYELANPRPQAKSVAAQPRGMQQIGGMQQQQFPSYLNPNI